MAGDPVGQLRRVGHPADDVEGGGAGEQVRVALLGHASVSQAVRGRVDLAASQVMDADVLVVGGRPGRPGCHAELASGRPLGDRHRLRTSTIPRRPGALVAGRPVPGEPPEQRRLRIRDSAELALADWLGSAAFDRPEDYWPRQWAEAYVEFAAGEEQRWLHELGVRCFPLVQWAERGGYPAPGHGNTVPRFHLIWGTGPALVQPFADAVLQSRGGPDPGRHRVTAIAVAATAYG